MRLIDKRLFSLIWRSRVWLQRSWELNVTRTQESVLSLIEPNWCKMDYNPTSIAKSQLTNLCLGYHIRKNTSYEPNWCKSLISTKKKILTLYDKHQPNGSNFQSKWYSTLQMHEQIKAPPIRWIANNKLTKLCPACITIIIGFKLKMNHNYQPSD